MIACKSCILSVVERSPKYLEMSQIIIVLFLTLSRLKKIIFECSKYTEMNVEWSSELNNT